MARSKGSQFLRLLERRPMNDCASYPPDVKVIRVKRGEKVSIQWEYSGGDGHVPHIREARISEEDADTLTALDVIKRRLFKC